MSRRSAEVDAYIAGFPPTQRARLKKVRAAIRAAAPKADETISYRIPAYRGNRVFIFFAGFKSHIGMFPPVRGNAALVKAVSKYANAKGNLRFPDDAPLPLALITRIAKHQASSDRDK